MEQNATVSVYKKMNAVSRLTLRTKIILCFMGVLCLGFAAASAVEGMVAEPRIEIAFSHYETNQNARFAIIDIRNVGNAAAIYSGYATNSPDCEVQYRTGAGAWSGRILRCIIPADQILSAGGNLLSQINAPGGALQSQIKQISEKEGGEKAASEPAAG